MKIDLEMKFTGEYAEAELNEKGKEEIPEGSVIKTIKINTGGLGVSPNEQCKLPKSK